MKRNKYLVGLLAVLLCFGLSGCQLAKDKGSEEELRDQLIGAFVTRESLKEDARFYAVTEKRAHKDSDTGEKRTSEVYTFPQLEGMYFYYIVDFSAPDAINSVSGPNEGMDNGGVFYSNYFETEEEDTRRNMSRAEMKGTFYGVMENEISAFYANPMYRTPEGEVYVIAGQGVSGESPDGKLTLTQAYSEVSQITMGSDSKECEFSYAVSFALRNVPQHIRILQMSEDGQVLERTEFAPGKAPEELTLTPEMAYLIAESEGTNFTGESVTDRELVNKGEENVTTWYPLDNGFFTNQLTALHWGGAVK